MNPKRYFFRENPLILFYKLCSFFRKEGYFNNQQSAILFRNLQFFSLNLFLFLLPFLVVDCNSSFLKIQEEDKKHLLSLKKFTIEFSESIPIEIKNGSMFNSSWKAGGASEDFYNKNTLGIEKAYGNGLKNALKEIGNNDAKFISIQSLGFTQEDKLESEKEQEKIINSLTDHQSVAK